MTYKYYTCALPTVPTSASAAWINDFQAGLSYQFDNATDVFDILEESPFASGSYTNIRVRITSCVEPLTGIRKGDDWKRIIFEDIAHPVSVGMLYSFSDNFWLVTNCENIKSLTASVTIRRCSNVLRWTDSNGIVQSVPCVVEEILNNPRDDTPNTNLVTPGGLTKFYCQLNSVTRKIREGQRFLMGNSDNWICFKVVGGGIRNNQNLKTLNNVSAQLLTLDVITTQDNYDTDDIVNGVADYYKYNSSASSIANIVITPNNGTILESGSQIYDAHYYSGSTILSGSFIFSVSGSNVPVSNYTFTSLTSNTFSVVNNERYMDYPLLILCSGSSGSRIFDVSLAGAW